MLAMKNDFAPELNRCGVEVVCADVVQTLDEDELCKILPDFDGWVIGDDPASRRVLSAGCNGRLRAAVKWGVGVDNVDFEACSDLGLKIANTPDMFGEEVADLALHYLTGLARETFAIDRKVRLGDWPKPQGVSLAGLRAGLVGFGSIGQQLGVRLKACGMNLLVFDPNLPEVRPCEYEVAQWPNKLDECDFLVFTCSLNANNRAMLNDNTIRKCKTGVRIVNVSRGPLIDEGALEKALVSKKVHSAALDVFEIEPLPQNSKLREHPLCLLGSHNGSNTIQAVQRTNTEVIKIMLGFLGLRQ